jgi:glycosyltransferase involved in cell wall biosynthesis
MRPVYLDITPALINRTAIHHIVKDSIAALSTTFDIVLSVAGRRVGADALNGTDSTLLDSFWACLGHPQRLGEYVRPHPGPDITTLFFDPLYVLFVDRLLPHDVVFVLDLTTISNPTWHEPNVAALYARAFEKIVASQAKLVAISEHTRLSIAANLPVPSSDIATVTLYPMQSLDALAPEPVAALDGQKFLLFVGSLETRKNIAGLISAFEASRIARQGYHLAIAGGDGKGADEIKARARGVRNVHLLGFVSGNALAWLYGNALWFVYPSYLEGFGVPVLEAMRAALPIVGSITGAVPAVAGDAGLFFDPYDPEQMRRSIGSLPGIPDDRRADMASRSKRRSAGFSLERYGEELKSIVAVAATR